jgi:hypothetical protein
MRTSELQEKPSALNENIQHMKHEISNFFFFSSFLGNFVPPGSGCSRPKSVRSGSTSLLSKIGRNWDTGGIKKSLAGVKTRKKCTYALCFMKKTNCKLATCPVKVHIFEHTKVQRK